MSYKHVVAIARGSVALSIGIAHFDPDREDEDGRYQHQILTDADAAKAEKRGLVKIEDDASEAEFKAARAGVSARPAEIAAKRLEDREFSEERTMGAASGAATSLARNFPLGTGPEAATSRSGFDPDAAPGGEEGADILDQSVKKLEAASASIESVEEIASLIDAEIAGKNRDTAVKALEERKATLEGSE